VEPGRAIVGPAGVTVYTVRGIKRRQGTRIVAVDGGFTDNLRPALYGSRYTCTVVRNEEAAAGRLRSRVVGTHCESGDVLLPEVFLPADLAVGDLLAVPATGAYGYAMASTYNPMPRPAVLFDKDGRARVVIRRETDEDLLRLDVPPTTEGSLPGAQQCASSGAA
jgi:diaminopimelate decarboxylase